MERRTRFNAFIRIIKPFRKALQRLYSRFHAFQKA